MTRIIIKKKKVVNYLSILTNNFYHIRNDIVVLDNYLDKLGRNFTKTKEWGIIN